MRVRLGDVCEKGSSNLKQSDVIDKNGEYEIYGASGLIGKVDFFHQEKPYIAVVKDGAGIGRTIRPPKSIRRLCKTSRQIKSCNSKRSGAGSDVV